MNALNAIFPRVHGLESLQTRLLAAFEPEAAASAQASADASIPAEALLAALPVGIYTTDAKGLITFYNKAAARLWGRRPPLGNARWCGAWRTYSSDGVLVPRNKGAMAAALKTGAAVSGGTIVAERPDGSRVPFASYPALLRDGDGRVTGAINMIVDLTRAKILEAALRESEAHGQSVIELNPQMPWTADPRGRVLEFGDQWCKFIGLTHEQALERGWQSLVNPDDRPRVLAAMQAAMATEEPYDIRYRVRVASGKERWVRARAHPRRDAEGEIFRWYGSTEDIHDSVVLEEEARAAGQRHKLVSEAIDDVTWDMSLVTDAVIWSPVLKRRFGVWPDGGKSTRGWWLDRIHPEDRARIVKTVGASLFGSSEHHTAEYRFRRGDGSYAYVLDRSTLIRNDQGKVIQAVGAMLDRSESKNAEEALRLSEERFRLAATVARLGVADIDMVTKEEHWSAELRAILGISDAAPACMETYSGILHPDDRAVADDQHLRALGGEFSNGEEAVYRIVRPSDGGLRWIATERHAMRNDAGEVVRVIMTHKDITEEKTAQDRIARAAAQDAVTGLQNRTQFRGGLDNALAAAGACNDVVSLLLLDIDNFKRINDTFGHHAGDEALAAFAARISEAMPEGANFIRFGGDEFAIILPGRDATSAVAIGEGFLRVLEPPFFIGGRNIDLRASIGASMFPRDGSDSADLVRCADLALYAAKAAGRATVRGFEPVLQADLQRELAMLSKARSALENGWIQPFFQPKAVLGTGRVAGFEALLRWRKPRSRLQMPDTIASAFGDTELAGRLGEVMVEAVLARLRGWMDRGVAVGRIAINASAAEFRGPNYAERMLERLARHGVPAALLELEITETALLNDSPGHVVTALEKLRAAGMTVALDDFGTGCSSLSHLRHFPVDTIKIDRSFVAGLDDCASDRAIIEAVLRLGAALGMTTVAEGIETQTQADFVRAHGCTLGQGFLFAPALPAAKVAKACQVRYRPSRD